MRNAFFSVIIPTFNRENFLRKAVNSVLTQTFKEWELIIVDDGSTDNTMHYVNSLNDERIVYIKQENKGPAGARNVGVKQAKTCWICFLDSDDWWDKRKLEITFGYILKYPDYKIFHTQEIWFKRGKLLNQKKKHRKYGGWIFEKCLSLCRVSISTVCIHKSVFKEVGGFDENLRCCEDYDFWLRVSLKYPFCLIDLPLTLKDGGRSDQVSFQYWGMDRFRIYALQKILEIPTLPKDKYLSAFEELERKCLIYIKGCIKRGKIEEARFYESIIDKYKKKIPMLGDGIEPPTRGFSVRCSTD